jgi:short subunit dehydrogenase-like uncharacterized protein
MTRFLLYGANGYTGNLIAREAVRRGLRPLLAGRTAQAVRQLAEELGTDHRAFALEDAAALDDALRATGVVLHCAGPFAHTWKPMAEACLRTGAHYLDITGEIEVFEALAARGEEARQKGVMLLPGAGFDVVPSDCLAAHLKRRLPTATHLALAIASSSRMSRGTATTVVEGLWRGGMVRRGGVLRKVPSAWKTRVLDLGRGPQKAITIPWGDVATAWHSTGIPNIEVYMVAPTATRVAAKLLRPLGCLVGTHLVQRFLKKRIHAGPAGPTEEERAKGWSVLWGEVTDAAGNRAVSLLRGPDGYTFTVLAALRVLERVLAGQAPAGFQTPALAYGPDLVLDVEGVERIDL